MFQEKIIVRKNMSAKNINIAFALCIALGFVGFAYGASYIFTDSAYVVCMEEWNTEIERIQEEDKARIEKCYTSNTGGIADITKCLGSPSPLPKNTCVNTGSGTAPIVISSTTLRDKFGLSSCRFINEHHAIPSKNLEWVAYDIACEKGVAFNVKSPGEYAIVEIGYGTNLGNYIILRSNDENSPNNRIVLGHTATDRKVGEHLHMGDIVGQTNVSGASTGMHVHIELWEGHMNVTRGALLDSPYSKTDGRRLLANRKWDFGQGNAGDSQVYYFTAYNLGDVNQNDSTPCIGASGKDLCYLEKSGVRTMALTSDIRKTLGVSFGDSVRLTGDEGCEGIYQVEDEMNVRFRASPGIKRPGTNYYIKGDLPSKGGGACSITPL